MGRRLHRLMLLPAVALLATGLGFLHFASSIRQARVVTVAKADGIVVLTGGDERIIAGMDLLRQGRAQRLLISGVHPGNRSVRTLLATIDPEGPRTRLTQCCVDLGYAAQNTAGNSLEARDWSIKKGYRKLIIVTSDYHMPRSLAEFSDAMPGVELIAYPVTARYLNPQAWWQDRATAKVLLGEYAKLLIVRARVGIARLFGTQVIARKDTPIPEAI